MTAACTHQCTKLWMDNSEARTTANPAFLAYAHSNPNVDIKTLYRPCYGAVAVQQTSRYTAPRANSRTGRCSRQQPAVILQIAHSLSNVRQKDTPPNKYQIVAANHGQLFWTNCAEAVTCRCYDTALGTTIKRTRPKRTAQQHK